MPAKTMIIAEDDPGMQDAINLIFTRAGYDLTIISDGEPILNNQLPVPAVFVLDKQLSGTDGLDLCRFLKNQESTRAVPVVMLSASPTIGALALEAGADAYLEKPFRMKVLLELVQSLV